MQCLSEELCEFTVEQAYKNIFRVDVLIWNIKDCISP
jgi:hypothetical protein